MMLWYLKCLFGDKDNVNNKNNVLLPLHCYYSCQLSCRQVDQKVNPKSIYLMQMSQ